MAHLQVVVVAVALVWRRLYVEEVPEVHPDEVAVLRSDGAGAHHTYRREITQLICCSFQSFPYFYEFKVRKIGINMTNHHPKSHKTSLRVHLKACVTLFL